MEAFGLGSRRGSRHARHPTLDYSPLAQSVSAFSDEAVTSKHVLRDSQRIQTGNPPSAPTPSAGDHATAPCGQPSRTDSNLDRTGSGAPVGSAWNPWQGLTDMPAPPLRRVVAHRPNPSWFSPVVGFGGPPTVVWQQEQRQEQGQGQEQPPRSSAEQRQPQGRQPSSQSSHAARQAPQQPHPAHPPPRAGAPSRQAQATGGPPASSAAHTAGSQPLAFDLARLQQSLAQLPGAPAERERPHPQQQQQQQQRSPPWYTQGWQRAAGDVAPQAVQQAAEAAQRATQAHPPPGGNPGVIEQAQPSQPNPQAAIARKPGPPQQALGARPGAAAQGAAGSSTRRKLPPPPRFLLSQQAHQQGKQQPRDAAAAQHAAGRSAGATDDAQPAPAPCTAFGRGPAAAAHDAAAGDSPPQSRPCHGPLASEGVAWQGGRPETAASLKAEQAAATSAPPAPPPPPLPRLRALGAAPPPPPPPPPGAGCRASASPLPPAWSAAGPRRAAPPPPPLPAPVKAGGVAGGTAAVAASEQAIPTSREAASNLGGSALSVIKPAELAAAAGRLRKVSALPGPGGGGRPDGCGSKSGAAASSGSRGGQPAAPQGDPRAQLMAAIQGGNFKLRRVDKAPRKEAKPGGSGTPLAAPTAGMAELLRRVAERRRVEDSEGDSDSEW